MAPSGGHLLVPKIVRIAKFGLSKTASAIRSRFLQSTTSEGTAALQPIRVYAQQPTHPLAYLKQSRSSNNTRWFSSTARAFTSSAKPQSGRRYDRSKFPISKTSQAISRSGAAPFASTLRPNLTGGALPRSAGGYGVGAVRHFSHTSGCQAQVVQNVSAGIRAFFIGGGKARFDGVDPVTGEKRFRAVSQTEDAVYTKWESPVAKSMKGTNLDFKLNPTITALSPSSFPAGSKADITSLNSINLLDNLAVDFARALKDLSAILTDLRRLSAFGDLPISIHSTSTGQVLRVRFPGCDADLVSRLCEEVGVLRGLVVEDEAWDQSRDVQMALLFPFAPTNNPSAISDEERNDDSAAFYFSDRKAHAQEQLDWRNMLSPSTYPTTTSIHSNTSFDDLAQTLRSPILNPKSPLPSSSYESICDDDFESFEHPYHEFGSPSPSPTKSKVKLHDSAALGQCAEYEGLEGIYKFLRVCEEAKR